MSDLYLIPNASGTSGNLDAALTSLLSTMSAHGLQFYKTASQAGLIGSNDVVVIKVNSEWCARGGTNSDLIKAIIQKIVSHPSGFTGEVVIADNGQWTARASDTDWRGSDANNVLQSTYNSYSQAQSMVDVATYFSNLGYKVSTKIWDYLRFTNVSDGSATDGYVSVAATGSTGIVNITYPKFTTKYGTRISLKSGVWNGSAYDNIRLKFINVPVLKSHANYGVTGCVKSFMGVLSNVYDGYGGAGKYLWGTWGHPSVTSGGMATEMVGSRFPTLHILDCIYVNANPYESGKYGPNTPYANATYTNTIIASVDPVALDYYASKHILMPASTGTNNSINPDYAGTVSGLSGSFHSVLANSMTEFTRLGITTTMTETLMNVYTPSAPVNHSLTINATPVNVTFTFNGASQATPYGPVTVQEGVSYTITMPVTSGNYTFQHWNDGNTSNSRTFSFTADTTLTATYLQNVLTHQLTVQSTPINVTFTIAGTSQNSPYSQALPEGSYTVVMPSTSGNYTFQQWSDGNTNPSRTVSLTADTTLSAVYVLNPPVQVNFTFSKPYQAGTTVNLTLTKTA